MRRALACVAAWAALAAGAAEPVAFVADIAGNATIEGDGNVAFLAELSAGTKLLLGTGATVSVTFAANGSEFTLRGPGEFVVAANEVRAEKGAKLSKRTVAVLPDPGIIAKLSRTANASLRMRGIAAQPSKIAIEYPVNTRVTSLKPTLRWRAEPATEMFAVVLADSTGKEVWRGDAQPGTLKPNVKLAPETAYTWTVMTGKGARAAEGRFETLSAAAMAKLDKAHAAARTFPDRVIYASMLQEVGATEEAREAWAALARERPDLPELAALAR